MRFRRSTLARLVLAIFVFVGFMTLTNITLAWLAVQRLAQYIVRYAVTDVYNFELCDEPKIFERAEQSLHNNAGLTSIKEGGSFIDLTASALRSLDQTDGDTDCRIYSADLPLDIAQTLNREIANAARYYSLHQLANDATFGVLDPQKVKVAICSDRADYSYDSDIGVCAPNDDTGEAGGKVFVNVEYKYQLGWLFGLRFWEFTLKTTRDGIVECHRLGCGSGLWVALTGNVPEEYLVEAVDSTGEKRVAQCVVVENKTVIASEERNDLNAPCMFFNPEAFFLGYTPDVVTVTVSWANGSASQAVQPVYRTWRPNGGRCTPECKNATIVFTIP